MMWQYKRVNYEFKMNSELESILNKEGKKKWEVIFYQEQSPKKFGENYQTSVLYKRKKRKSIIRQLQSG